MSHHLNDRITPHLHPGYAPYAQQLLDRARRALRARVGDPRTEEVYAAWIRRFLEFAQPRNAGDLDDLAAGAFLARLALVDNPGPTALKRARRALMFLDIVVLRRIEDPPAPDIRVA